MTTTTEIEPTPLPVLDRWQHEAATAEPGPILIAGGAGSGRTTTLAARIKFLIESGNNGATISCLSMSSANSELLRQQVESSMEDKEAVRGVFFCTYHHMASTILRNTGAAPHLGLSPHFTIWDTDQSIEVIQSLIQSTPDELTLSNNEIKDILSWDGLNKARWKLEQPLPPKQEYWFDVLKEYKQEKQRQNIVDLNDLIPLAVQALETAPNIRRIWRSVRTRHLLADDFQDITPIQYRLLQLITSTERFITATVDPNQSVYSWRGADPRLIRHFQLDFSNTTTFLLRSNHRQTISLHDSLNTLLNDEEMTGLASSNQIPSRETTGNPPIGIAFDGNQEEMNAFMLDRIEDDVLNRRFQWGDIAILFRRRNLGSNIITQLVSRNIPYTIVGDNDGPDKGTTKRTLALLTLALNPWDTATFATAATIESDDTQRGLNPNVTNAIAKISREENINLISAAQRFLPKLQQGVKTRLNIDYAIAASTRVKQILDDPETDLPFLCFETEKISRGNRQERYTQGPVTEPEASKLITMSRNCQMLPGETLRQQLSRFLESLKGTNYPELQGSDNADPYAHNSGLILSSIHSSKGKEWKSVWLINTNDAVMPGAYVTEQNTPRLEEEQRLFYTGSARAADALTYIYPMKDGTGAPNPRSRFLSALDQVVPWYSAKADPNHEDI